MPNIVSASLFFAPAAINAINPLSVSQEKGINEVVNECLVPCYGHFLNHVAKKKEKPARLKKPDYKTIHIVGINLLGQGAGRTGKDDY